MKYAQILCLLFGSIYAAFINAESAVPVEVVGLFSGQAVLQTSAGPQILKVGQTTNNGVRLIAADTSSAIVEYKGKTHTLKLSNKVATTFTTPQMASVKINRDDIGQYRTRGAINGSPINFLVDTGASIVAMSEQHAKSVGIDFRNGDIGQVQTAQGTTQAYFVNLTEVRVGGIVVHNVRATILEGNYPLEVLLGMSFLNSVNMQDNHGVLTLTAKF